MQAKLNPQAEKIYYILQDLAWHCPREWNYADGHCKRITDINNWLKPTGFKIDSEVCNCGRHESKILKRRIVPLDYEKPQQPKLLRMTNKIKEWNQQFATVEPININQPLW